MGPHRGALTPVKARRLGLKSDTGIFVVDVADGSPADEAGVEAGDVIVEVNRRQVRSPADFRWPAQPSPNPLPVLRDSTSIFIELNRGTP